MLGVLPRGLTDLLFMRSLEAIISVMWVNELETLVPKVSLPLTEVSNYTALALERIQCGLGSLVVCVL